MARTLSCPGAHAHLPDQAWNTCPLLWQAVSQPLYYQRSLAVCTSDLKKKNPLKWEKNPKMALYFERSHHVCTHTHMHTHTHPVCVHRATTHMHADVHICIQVYACTLTRVHPTSVHTATTHVHTHACTCTPHRYTFSAPFAGCITSRAPVILMLGCLVYS